MQTNTTAHRFSAGMAGPSCCYSFERGRQNKYVMQTALWIIGLSRPQVAVAPYVMHFIGSWCRGYGDVNGRQAPLLWGID